MKTALITGITGQDGAYLAEFLLNKGYTVHGIKRRSSLFNTDRIDHLYQDPHDPDRRFVLHHGDMTDSTSLIHIIQKTQPDEIYNLAAQSHVAVSFEEPEYTANSDALGALRVLEAIRILGLEKKTRFYQASTSELFGKVQEIPQKETTPFYPRSPYAVAKLYAYWITVNYREAYGIYACNGILFNHESPIRGETFVTRKITRALARIRLGLQDTLYLGNLDAKRDWGHAKDYVEMQWLMLQQEQPEDFVIATGQQYSVRDFVNAAAAELGMEIGWEGQGVEEKGYWVNAPGGSAGFEAGARAGHAPTAGPADLVGASLARERAAGAAEVGAASNTDSRAGHAPTAGPPNPVGASPARERAAGAAEVGAASNTDSREGHAPTTGHPNPVGASLARERAAGAGGVGAASNTDSRAGHAPTGPIIAVDPRYFRPTEVETLLGDATKAREKLGWTPRITFEELVAEMVREDLAIAQRDDLVRNSGYTVMNHHE